MVPGLSMTYIPAKLTRSVEEAKTIAAEYSLVQLGYPMEGMYVTITDVVGDGGRYGRGRGSGVEGKEKNNIHWKEG